MCFFDPTEQAHSLVKVNPRLETALKERSLIAQLNSPDPGLPLKNSTSIKVEKDSNKQPLPVPTNVGLKGVNQSLIDKVINPYETYYMIQRH